MTEPLYKQEGFLLTLLASAILISIAWVMEYHKTLFVPPTGNFKVGGSQLWTLLAILLLFRSKLALTIVQVLLVISISMVLFFMSLTDMEYLLSHAVLASLFFVVFFLLRSEPIRAYINK